MEIENNVELTVSASIRFLGTTTSAREALDAHYRAFITYLNAVQEIQPEEGISQAAQFYDEDIRKIEQQIAQSRKKKKDEDSGDMTSVEPETTTVQPE